MKKTFVFNVKRACTGEVDNGNGMRCVVGQFYGKVAKKNVASANYHKVLEYFREKTGIHEDLAININDGSGDWKTKATALKNLFKKSKTYTIKVVGL